jgi:hypothetical protein
MAVNPTQENYLDGLMARKIQDLENVFSLQTLLIEDLPTPIALNINENNMAVVVNDSAPSPGYTAIIVGPSPPLCIGNLAIVELPSHNYLIPLTRVAVFNYDGQLVCQKEFPYRESRIPRPRPFQF